MVNHLISPTSKTALLSRLKVNLQRQPRRNWAKVNVNLHRVLRRVQQVSLLRRLKTRNPAKCWLMSQLFRFQRRISSREDRSTLSGPCMAPCVKWANNYKLFNRLNSNKKAQQKIKLTSSPANKESTLTSLCKTANSFQQRYLKSLAACSSQLDWMLTLVEP